jgi:NTE family protein
LTKIGLALGGGVTRGAAHVGVLTVLEREQIPIACVTGASAGALVGALYCGGLGPQAIEKAMERFGWRHLARLAFSRRGLVSFEPLERWLISMIGDVTFAELRRPLAVVATDLLTGLPRVLCEGRVAPAVRASCSVPGVVVPLELDGQLLVDGCIADTVPVSAARALGADYVVGVDIFGAVQPRPRNLVAMAFGALEHLLRRAGGGYLQADCLISPQLNSIGYVGFKRTRETAERGAQAAEAALPRLRGALAALR